MSIWQTKAGTESAKWLFNWQLYATVAALLIITPFFSVERLDRDYSRSMLHDYLYGVIHTLIMVPTYTVVLVLQKTLTDNYFPWIRLDLLQQLSIPMQILIAFVVSDFLGYVSHYLRHRIEPLWFFHMTHHSQRHLNPFTTKRTHIVEHLFSKGLIRWIPLAVMGSPIETWLIFYWVMAVWDYFVHSNLRISLGFLRWILVSPQYHRIHHSTLEKHHDKNFGDKLVIWDLVFGTAYMNPSEYPATGVDDPSYPNENSLNPLRMLSIYWQQWCYPFRQIWRSMSARKMGAQGAQK